MLGSHVRRGAVVGTIGGIAYATYLSTVSFDLIEYAETFEAGGEMGGTPMVSAGKTAVLGAGAGVIWGFLLGVLVFGVLYYFIEPAIPGETDTKGYVLAAAGFTALSGAPWLVLPPQPPGIEQSIPTEKRLLWYAVMMVAGALAWTLSIGLLRRYRDQFETALLFPSVAIAFAAVITVPAILAPANRITGPVPTGIATAYRWTVVFGQVWLWTVLAATNAWLVRR